MLEQAQALTAHPGWRYLWPPAAGLGIFLVGLALRWLLLSRLQRWAVRTKWKWDDLLLGALSGPSVLWCLIAAVHVTVTAWPVSDRLQHLSGQLLFVLWMVSLTLAVLRASTDLIQQYSSQLSGALPLTSLTQNLTKGVIIVVGALMILNGLGIAITPLLTALGVGGLAVALGLQETLSNLFAGIYITMAHHVRLGDYIKLDSGEEGFVSDIGWRSTRLRTGPNNLIIIPNTKLGQSVVTNFDLPTSDLAVTVEVGVDYVSDLERVEKVTAEVGREVMKQVAGGVAEFEPVIRFHTFGDSSINFTVVLRARTFGDQPLVKHEFIKRLHRRYAESGITIPFPTRTVHLQQSP